MSAHPLRSALALLGALIVVGCASTPATRANAQATGTPSDAAQRAHAGEALWEEKCRTVAGEKIYKTVPDVEGLVLLKLRPKAWQPEWSDPYWPGAAFALEAKSDEYITSFLGYEYAAKLNGVPLPITPTYRGYIETDRRPGLMGRPGYRYVDVLDDKDGQRYRYKLFNKVMPGKDHEWIKVVLDKTPAPNPAPRYGVTFEDHVIPAERALGLASSTVKVIDLKTGEVLGEMLRYAWGVIGRDPSESSWLTAYKCPSHAVGANAATRKFVDQVLIPKKGD
ncbi:MAG: hypothetical protein IPH08_03435 [Rhodocyclaceae bacterium]|jgi:hypothetical protein|nr:hypothetical protein [Rhodocyclaceae bacterium]MBK6906214.1 hypothetical protein [Rhodocyclaceae bacterium]